MSIAQDLENFFHPIRTAVEKAVADAEADADAKFKTVANDVKLAANAAAAALKDDAPAIEAALQKGAAAVIQSVLGTLAAHGGLDVTDVPGA